MSEEASPRTRLPACLRASESVSQSVFLSFSVSFLALAPLFPSSRRPLRLTLAESESDVTGANVRRRASHTERTELDSTSATCKNTAAPEKCKQVKSLLFVLDIFLNDVGRALLFGTWR